MDEHTILAIAAAALGAILGSFLNALSFRVGTGRTMGGRSRCMRCGHALAAGDLVPLVSYFLLRGRCRYCRARISMQYPLVEAAAAALSVGVYLTRPEPLFYGLGFMIWLVILFAVVYDLRHTIIPWLCSGLLALLALVSLLLSGTVSIATVAAGPLLALPLLLISLVSKGRWMGWGDGAFELGLGLLLGPSGGLTALMLGVWAGAATGALLLGAQALMRRLTPMGAKRSAQRRFTMKSEVPFAPFLALGAALVYFLHVDFFSTLALFW